MVDAPSSETGEDVADSETAGEVAGIGSRFVRRVFRRPVAWWNRPWSSQRIVQVLVTSAILVTTTVIVMMVVHLNPLSPGSDLVFDRHHADRWRHGRPRLGAGVPARPPPAELPALGLDDGLVRRAPAVPLLHGDPGAGDRGARRRAALRRGVQAGRRSRAWCCSRWPAGRSVASPTSAIRFPSCSPSPALCFLLDESFSIYGGNVKSTMAGEYSFSIALTLGDARAGPARQRSARRASSGSGRRSCCRWPPCRTASC